MDPLPPMRILTVDLEDWFHLIDYEGSANTQSWDLYPSRIRANTAFLLDCFQEAGVRATFFSLGWVARKYPDLLRRILHEGHEVGSHSDVHGMVHQMSPEVFRADLRASIRSIEDATGSPVQTYRAPGFSITAHCPWAFEILAEAGITCDCSIFPGTHAHGGFSHPATEPLRLITSSGPLMEFPVTTRRLGGLVQVAFAGGGYFRFLPGPLIQRWTRQSPYLMTYFHPRDFDAGQPLLPGLSPIRRFKSYTGLRGSRTKLANLLALGAFLPVSQAQARTAWPGTPTLDLRSFP